MRDASITSGRTRLRAGLAALLLVAACSLGGCAGGGAASGSFAMAGDSPTIAFESIDGPPPPVFDRMVSVLDEDRMTDGRGSSFSASYPAKPRSVPLARGALTEFATDSETKLRSLAVVSRESPAAYRVRSYLSAQTVRGKAVIAWVWDVYDRDQQRALRLAGEEPAGKGGRDALRDPWAAADDLLLRKIAQAGLSGLTSMIQGTPEDPQPAPGPSKRGPAVASAEAPSPDSGSFGAGALGYTDR